MAQQQPFTNYVQKRFVVNATLLSSINEVRGEATARCLDRHPNDGSWQIDNLKKKFLESFALICSTAEKGGLTASAVCLEQSSQSSGTVLRLARNLGVPPQLLGRLHGLLNNLTNISRDGRLRSELERDLLCKIIDIDIEKIKAVLHIFSRPSVQEEMCQILAEWRNKNLPVQNQNPSFGQWIAQLPQLSSIPPGSSPAVLATYIQWASHARWTYFEELQALFSSLKREMPKWIKQIYKLGRYYVATVVMIKLAYKQPELFDSIQIKAVDSPRPVSFDVKEQDALSDALKTLNLQNHGEIVARLGKFWGEADPQRHFRRKCKHKLTVHAEMQLLSFYDRYPHLAPQLRFMGTSKKACYLCHQFMSRHPLRLSVFACHQKIYPSWMPAPCPESWAKRQKELIIELSRFLEKEIVRELNNELKYRRLINWDSTAGPSLTLMTPSIYSSEKVEVGRRLTT